MMRRLVLIGIFVMITGSATAVVGGPDASEGEMTIQGSGSTASSSVAVGPNGTEWKSSVKMDGRLSQLKNNSVENVSFSENGHKVEFEGYIQAPTPCHTISSEVREEGDSYILDIKTVREDPGNTTDGLQRTACAAQVVTIRYDGEFSAEEQFELRINHDNESVRTIGRGTDGSEKSGKNDFLDDFLRWFSELLG